MNGLLWRRDPRWRVLLATILTVALGGALVYWLPRDWASAPPAPPADPHATLVARHFQQGIAMLHAKQYEHAVTAFHQVLSYAPELPEAHVNMGFALIGLGKFEAARDFFNGATVLRPGQTNAYYGLGVALDALGDRDGALGAMRTYVHLAPADDAYRRRAESAIWEMTDARAKQQIDAPPGKKTSKAKS